ncbi:MAG: glycosyltransferase [Planctomycetes bacterium]|nr:glycosyltransferase [Planctomycetota bacterium]
MILVLAPYVPHPPQNGGRIRSRVLLDALAGHDVHLVAPVVDDNERARARELAGELGLTFHELAAAPAGGLGPPAVGRKLAHWARGRSELFARRWGERSAGAVRGLFAELDPDLVVADSSFVLPLLPAGRVPLLLFLHNLESDIFARPDTQRRGASERWSRRFEAFGMAREERRALRRAALTVTVSERDAALVRALAGDVAVAIVPNSVDLDRLPLQPRANVGPPRLLFVGGLDYPPNREAVAELVERHLPALRAAHPGLTVRLVGRDDAGFARALAARTAGIEACGLVDDVLPHYRQSDAAYLPIRSGGGTRIKILEAWAVGLPVVATAVAAEGLGAVDDVQLRTFDSVAQGVEALGAVLGGQGAALAASARTFVEQRYSHAAAIAALRTAIADLLADH